MKQPLVTILSPVYNGEKYISRFLDSILMQDYKNIELILINDGSTDKTEEIIKSYEEKLNKILNKFIYIKQKNLGAAGALNTGLKKVSGKYLTWPDSDDTLTKDSISMKVEFLEKNKEFGYVRTEALAFNENNINQPIYKIQRKDNKNSKTNLFEEFLFDKNIYFCDGCYMVRVEAMKKANPNMSIFVTKWGQNWQMLLPISYYEKCGYINKIGYNYYERKSSHSHNQKKYEDYIKKYNGYEEILLNVLNEMKIANYEKYKEAIKIKYSKIRLEYSIDFQKEVDFEKEYQFLKNKNSLTFKIRLYNIVKNKLIIKKMYYFIENLILFPKKVFNKIKKVVFYNDRF